MIHAALDKKVPFVDAMLLGYKAALCSPHFLFLTEPTDTKAKNPKLDDYAVASRLSYFLWSSMPDAKLIELAAKKELTKPATLRAQVERMLNDPKASRFTANFAGQWLDLRSINATSPDPQIYGEVRRLPVLVDAARNATVLRGDSEARLEPHELRAFRLDVLNQRLAQHYGIADVFGGELRR